MKTKICIFFKVFVTLFLLFDNCVLAQESKKDSTAIAAKKTTATAESDRQVKKTPTGAMVRSLIFPGLGQWYNNKKLKSLVIFGAETGLLANAISLNQKLVSSSDDLERNFYIENRNISVWWLVGVTLYSLGDAYVDAQLSDFDESPDLTFLQIKPIISAGGKGFVLSFCLNLECF